MAIISPENDMELRHLEHFVAVAEEGSFTRASARLHLVQSAVSVSVRSLERELGARLFDRTTHRVELTDSGRALLVEARRTLAAAQAARDAVASTGAGIRGTVRIGIMQSLVLVDLAAVLTRFHGERPAVQILPRTAPGGSAELVREVLDGRLDLAFVGLPGPYPPGLDVVLLAEEPMTLICPAGHPLATRPAIALADVAGEQFVDFPAGWGTRAGVDRVFADAGLRRESIVEVADAATVGALVRAGLGVAFVPPSILPRRDGVVLREVHPSPTFAVSVVVAADRPRSAATRALLDLVHAELRA
jgi:DNA-binding transcriptional LysR family regulator